MGIISRLSPSPRGARMYAGARVTRLTQGWQPTTGSADSELWSSFRNLRDRSRQLIRDNAFAKRAKLIIVNNVIGSGIAMEPKVQGPDGKLDDAVNDAIEEAYCEWARGENCHTGGVLGFSDMERQLFGQIVEAGEIFVRKHYTQFGESLVPLALEIIESERIADDLVSPVGAAMSNYYRMGVDRDEFGRALGFYLRKYHPGEFRYASGGDDPNLISRVPADQMYHLYVCDRWPQTRGEPWLHAAMRRLNDMDGYSEAEIVRARGAASYMGFIESPDTGALPNDQTDPNAQPQFDLEPGVIQRLMPGEKFNFADPKSPSAGVDPFMRLMLREVAAGVGPSYESLSRDYSQSNYSSSRLALLDDRDLWRVFQQWFIRSFREPLHREWLRAAVMSRAIEGVSLNDYAQNPKKYEAVSFKPRGWSWIDPAKEVQAYKEARRSGFMSTGMIIAATGGGVDREDVWSELAAENEDARERGLVLDTDSALVDDRGHAQSVTSGTAPDWSGQQPGTVPDAAGKPTQASVTDPPATAPAETDDEEVDLRSRIAGIETGQRELMTALVNQQPPVVHNYISPQPVHINTPDIEVNIEPAQINVSTPEVRFEAPPINVTTPEIKVDVAAPQVHFEAPPVNVTTPEVKVEVAAPQITVEAPKPAPAIEQAEIVERDDKRLARVVRTNRGDFEIVERDANGDALIVKRRSAA